MAISSPAKPLLLFLPTLLLPYSTLGASTKLFSEYIGAQFNGIKFTDVPINLDVQFHFILAFAIDYTSSTSGGSFHPTNGKFNVFWDSENLSASQVRSIKARHPNVKVALSLGGDSIGEHEQYVMFKATSVTSWVQNAVTSITQIIKDYDLDGIDIDYEHFASTTSVFTECIGQLITTLKKRKVISFASIAPFEEVQGQYMALWAKYKNVIDYVNFQFYAYDEGTTVAQFIKYFNEQTSNYEGGKVLASFTTEGKGGLLPENGFFTASNRLKSQGKLHGIFIWSADNSKDKGNDFQYERRSQSLLASTSN